jgi:chromosome segregation protein
MLAQAGQTLAVADSAMKSDRVQLEQLEHEQLKLGQQRLALAKRVKQLDTEIASTQSEATSIEQQAAQEQERVKLAQEQLAAVVARRSSLVKQIQTDRDQQFELARMTAKLQSDVATYQRELERNQAETRAKHHEVERLSQRHTALATRIAELSASDTTLQEQLARLKQSQRSHQQQLEELRRGTSALQVELESQRENRSVLTGRAEVLSGLERSREGFGAGVRAVLDWLDRNADDRSQVLGIVGELISTSRDYAPRVDLALGELAQRLVVQRNTSITDVLNHLGDLPGRVSFMPLDVLSSHAETHDLSQWTGAQIAASVVQVEQQQLFPLVWHLLGRVAFVPDAFTALAARQHIPHLTCITATGEVYAADGSQSHGPLVAQAGLVSRRSELRELTEEISKLNTQIQHLESAVQSRNIQVRELQEKLHILETEVVALSGEAGTLQNQLLAQRGELMRLSEANDLNRVEVEQLQRQQAELQQHLTDKQLSLTQATDAEETLRTRLIDNEQAQQLAERDREQRQADSTAAQVAYGQISAQLTAIRRQADELQSEFKLRRIDTLNLASTERSFKVRSQACQLQLLQTSATMAEAYALKDRAEATRRDLAAHREQLRSERDLRQQSLKAFRAQWTEQRDRAHAHEMLVRDLVHRRESLVQKLREDYDIDLTQTKPPADAAGTEDDPILLQSSITDPDATQDEIDELRKKMAKLGNVNLASLDELQEAEARESSLRTQHDDLVTSQKTLLEIIEQINTDSRKLFVETLNTVRVQFQDLFRKLFGGGMADILLEDDVDPLESGIEVTARPPGKELRSISLLSGGERTLTAIALLLAIFRSRPSPFCVLDEVDAALDEANTTRLASALHEFLDRSQFIIITHKKRTMAMADALYGITMQESGISKQVSIRFEDWPEDETAAA